jgi:poly(hydroxyalkanoate) granule-associated protein
MTDQSNTQTQTASRSTIQDELSQRGREVWLAGLGALATVEEEGSKLFGNLVDRGKEFEQERRTELEKATQKAREQRDEALSQLEEAGEETQSLLFNTINSALERFGVPNQTEIDRLSNKVDKLSQQVDALADALSEEQNGTDTTEA